jgi:hypothetical protein
MSIIKASQGDFVDALNMLWVKELCQYFQNAILPENLKEQDPFDIEINIPSNPQLPARVIEAMEKDRKPLRRLSYFITGWDFSRLAFLVDRLRPKEDPMPKLSEVKEILSKCRDVRNIKSHYDGDPKVDPFTDGKLLDLLDCTRNWLPFVNSQNKSQPADAALIYERLTVLESLIFPEKDKDVSQF